MLEKIVPVFEHMQIQVFNLFTTVTINHSHAGEFFMLLF